MLMDGEAPLTAKIEYHAKGQDWQIVATFTEPVNDENEAYKQFLEMIGSLDHR